MTKVTTKWLALVGVFLVAVAVGFANTAADLPEMDGVPTAEPEEPQQRGEAEDGESDSPGHAQIPATLATS